MDTEITAIDRVGSKFMRALLRRMTQLGLNQTSLARRMNVSRALEMDFIPTLAPVREGRYKEK